MSQGKSPAALKAEQERKARLAEQLRANLHRRKAQARALAEPGPDAGPEPGPEPGPERESPRESGKTDLPKS